MTPKFRAWDKERQKMCSVAEIHFDGKGNIERLQLYEEMNTINDCDIADIELMQWTGLKDSRGTEIFESDILCYDHGGGVDTYIIERNPDDNQLYARYLYITGDATEYLAECPFDVSVIVGNAWENPEMMRGT